MTRTVEVWIVTRVVRRSLVMVVHVVALWPVLQHIRRSCCVRVVQDYGAQPEYQYSQGRPSTAATRGPISIRHLLQRLSSMSTGRIQLTSPLLSTILVVFGGHLLSSPSDRGISTHVGLGGRACLLLSPRRTDMDPDGSQDKGRESKYDEVLVKPAQSVSLEPRSCEVRRWRDALFPRTSNHAYVSKTERYKFLTGSLASLASMSSKFHLQELLDPSLLVSTSLYV